MTSGTNEASPLIALFEREGYARVEPPILQPIEPFIDLSGEDIRRRMFVTQDADGRELCLRPDYTIPVCRQHLASGRAQPASYSYLGPLFRLRKGEPSEFQQAGIESIGRSDRAAADAEILSLALEGLDRLGPAEKAVKLGDMGLLDAVAEALRVSPATKRRLMRAVVSGRALDSVAEPDSASGLAEHAGLLAAIQGQDAKAVKGFVEDIIAIAGIARVGGRSAGEIAERFLARAANRSGGLPDEAREVLSRYLMVTGDPDAAANAVRALARDADLDIARALDSFEERTGFMAARGVDISGFVFAADFARNLDYYTGFIFEVRDPRRSEVNLMVGGGRYDRLLQHLGATDEIPAVGCSFWLDRIAGAMS
ncbi:MAG TPA: ATP phosphoribosyltransferase regulatory subunit [Beijerinckiaceae bacterium]|jgi:ATP phosphoribosyltransferase regulatory subunit